MYEKVLRLVYFLLKFKIMFILFYIKIINKITNNFSLIKYRRDEVGNRFNQVLVII